MVESLPNRQKLLLVKKLLQILNSFKIALDYPFDSFSYHKIIRLSLYEDSLISKGYTD